MDIAYQFGLYLQASGFGTLNTDLFVGQIPDDTNGIYIVRSGGVPAQYTAIEETMLDIYCKDISSATCVEKLERIKRHVHRMYDTTTTNALFYSMLVVTDVTDVDRDMEYYKIYKISVLLLARDRGAIS